MGRGRSSPIFLTREVRVVGFTPSRLVEKRGRPSEEDVVAAFLGAGYNRAQILEVIVGIAFKTLSNFTNHLADTPIDKQFAPFAWEPARDAPSAA